MKSCLVVSNPLQLTHYTHPMINFIPQKRKRTKNILYENGKFVLKASTTFYIIILMIRKFLTKKKIVKNKTKKKVKKQNKTSKKKVSIWVDSTTLVRATNVASMFTVGLVVRVSCAIPTRFLNDVTSSRRRRWSFQNSLFLSIATSLSPWIVDARLCAPSPSSMNETKLEGSSLDVLCVIIGSGVGT